MNYLSVSIQTQGILWTALLLLLCIIFVHAFKLSKIGYRSMRKNLPEEPPKIPEKKPEPVYYIVEKKKKRSKTQFDKPREVQFKS